MKSIFMVMIVALAASCASANMYQQQPRGIVDTILATLGFDQILSTVQSVGTALYSQLISLATQALLAGQNMWAQAQPVFSNLVAELTAHTGNAVVLVSQAVQQLTAVLASGPSRSARAGIVDTVFQLFGLNQIMSQVQNVGSALYNQFVQLSTQLLFAGQQMWQQALPVFNNLVAELTAHTGNAVVLVSQAVQQLTAVLASGPARSVAAVERIDLFNMIANAFNLGGVMTIIQSVGTNVYSSFMNILTQLLFSGQQMWAQAQPVFNNLVAELTAHTGNAVVIVSQAVQQLTAVLASGPQRAVRLNVVDFLVNTLGLGPVWSMVQSVGTNLYSQLLSLMTQLLFAGQQVLAQATPIFNNLVAELTAHTGNAVTIVSQAVLQLTAVLASGPARSARFDLVSTIVNTLGLGQVWTMIQSVGSNLYSQFLSLTTQLLFAGQQVLAQAKPIFSNLVAELTAHTGNAVVIVSQAVQQLTAVLASGPASRGLVDTIVNAFGLGQVWSLIQSVGTNLFSTFLGLLTQLMFAGQQMWAQAQPVFNNLVAELTAHTGNAVVIVSQAVQQLTAVLASGPARSIQRAGLIDTLVGFFNLAPVWDAITSVGTAVYSQFLSLLTQLLFAGQQMWAQATPVFSNLVAELTAHTGNAVVIVSQAVQQLTAVLASGPASRGLVDTIVNAFGLGQVWSLIQSVGTNLFSTFLGLLTQLMFAGQQMWAQAQPVFNNLVAELTAHTGNAVVIVSQAVQQLTAVLASGPARSIQRAGLIDTLVGFFNLAPVWDAITSVGTAVYSQFLSLLTQLLFAGQQMWAQATPVFSNLVAELTAHTGNAVVIVSQAVQQLTAVLANGPASRGIVETLVNTFGLGPVWSMVQSVGTNLYSQLVSLMTQLLFAGQQMWQQAVPVFNNLVAELTAHTGNAVVLVSQAVQQLTAVLASGPAY